MDYEKKYKEALERARQFSEKPYLEDSKGIVDYIFPELKESEDERIRKWIMKELESKYVVDNIVNNVMADKALAWLEKQGEQKPVDKVDSKFKVGDWVVSPNGVYWHIDAIKNNRYEVSSTDGACADWPLNTNLYHLWTIQDVKDGDVLFLSTTASSDIFIFKEIGEDNMVNCYCTYDSEDGFREGKYHFIGSKNNKYHPATQVQRDTLEKAMTDAGYTFDFEKKELKKIERKTALSGEDEKKILLLEALCDDVINSSASYSTMHREMHELKDWLKSLRPQK